MEHNGIINLLKPAGMTSHDCVYQLRKITGIKRIGHTGTLDPMAAGVLPLCIGSATRVMDYLDMDKKSYRCEMIFGLTTDTWDIWGELMEDRRRTCHMPSLESINDTFEHFLGNIFQIPPQYSAIKIKGKRLYEYAREGKEIEAEKRPVVIYRLEIISYNRETGRLLFDMICSKGTYVRSICHETGKILACGGAMSFLLRTGSGDFELEESVTFEALATDWKGCLLPPEFPLSGLGKIKVSSDRASWFCNGGHIRAEEAEILRRPQKDNTMGHMRFRPGLDNAFCVYIDNNFLGVALFNEDEKVYRADKVFNR
ncbi:tRNA pseudouridine(55) synthase TruB [Bacillota bacterium]